jgi:P-type Cu2+ transporter
MNLDGEVRRFCCPGCLAAATTIANCGLDDFYRLRDKTQTQVELDTEKTSQYAYLDNSDFRHSALIRQPNGSIKLSLSLIGLTCAACVWLIEKYLLAQEGVQSLSINQVNQRASIEFDPNLIKPSEILHAIDSLGYQSTLDRGVERTELLQQERKRSLMRLGVAAIGMMQVGMYAIALHAGTLQGISDLERDLMRHAALLLCTLIVFYSARPFFTSAWSSIKQKTLVMDVPVSIAILAAYSASLWSTLTGGEEVYFDSVAMFTFFLLISRYWENQARSKLDLQPVQSIIPDLAVKTDIQGSFTEEVGSDQLQVGDLLLIEPGKRVPVDLKILSGSGEVDESVLTGEFKPVFRSRNDELIAGSLNGESRFVGEILRLKEDSSLAIVDRLYDQALMKRGATQELADRWAGRFIALVLIAAAITYMLWQAFDSERAFWVVLSVLVVSCPCALSLATPTSIAATMFALRSRGILVRHSAALDEVRTVTDVVFDKTGTLTEGRAKISKIRIASDLSEQQCLGLAASLESNSTHPFAKAFVATTALEDAVDEIQVIAGGGVEGRWREQKVRIGNSEFVGSFLQGVNLTSEAESGAMKEEGVERQIPIYLTGESELLAIFYLEDPIKSSATETLRELKRRGLKLHMLTGDPSQQCADIAADLGISSWKNHCSAADKLGYLEELKAQGAKILLVGDGINDVPAMGLADISLVVAQAPELVRARSDIGLIGPDLRVISALFDQCKRLSTVLRQNIFWAVAYNLGAIPAAAMGLVAPWLAAIGMSLSSAVVVLNALRLKKFSSRDNSIGVARG